MKEAISFVKYWIIIIVIGVFSITVQVSYSFAGTDVGDEEYAGGTGLLLSDSDVNNDDKDFQRYAEKVDVEDKLKKYKDYIRKKQQEKGRAEKERQEELDKIKEGADEGQNDVSKEDDKGLEKKMADISCMLSSYDPSKMIHDLFADAVDDFFVGTYWVD